MENYVPTNEIEASRQRILENRTLALELLQDRVVLFEAAPERASADTLRSYFATQIQLETGRLTDASLEDKVEALLRLENWYTSRNVAFPNQAWLQSQKEKLQRELES